MKESTKDCPVCGEAISADAQVCHHCDCNVGTSANPHNDATASPAMQTSNQSTPDLGSPTNSSVATVPELWNPNAAALWSLLFTPIFGSALMMMNWKTMGNKAEADKSLCWLVVSVLMICFYAFLSDSVSGGISTLFLVIWYFLSASQQISYVKREFGEKYQRKDWKVPLLIAGISVAVCIFLSISEEVA